MSWIQPRFERASLVPCATCPAVRKTASSLRKSGRAFGLLSLKCPGKARLSVILLRNKVLTPAEKEPSHHTHYARVALDCRSPSTFFARRVHWRYACPCSARSSGRTPDTIRTSLLVDRHGCVRRRDIHCRFACALTGLAFRGRTQRLGFS